MPRSRRALLETAAAALASSSITLTAGCLGVPSASTAPDQSSPAASQPADSASTAPPPAFRQWLPNPAATPLRDGYGVRFFDIERIRATRPAIHETAYARLEDEMLRPVPDRFVDVADVDASVAIDHVMNLVHGSFDPAAIGEKITRRQASSSPATRTPTTPTQTPWAEPERYRGFDLYGSEYVYAVSEDVVMDVGPMREADALAATKAIIDAAAGEVSQYAAGNEYVASLFGLVDAPHALWCYPEAMDGSTARGFRTDSITGGLKTWQFGSETTRLTYANTYVDAETAASGELSTFIESESDRFGPYDGLDVTVDGRLAWTEGTIPTSEFDYLSAGGPGDGVHTPN